MKFKIGDTIHLKKRTIKKLIQLSLMDQNYVSKLDKEKAKELVTFLTSYFFKVDLKGTVVSFGARIEERPQERYIGVKLYNSHIKKLGFKTGIPLLFCNPEDLRK